MTISVFFKLVEIQTKLASIFPFLMGVLFSLTYFNAFNAANTVIFFCGMLVFDMTTTAINNFMDYKKAKDETYKYQVNIVGQAGLQEKHVTALILTMLAFSAVIGAVLVYRTGWMMLILGGLCCLIGVFYTFGPVPLSRMPLGEIFSGGTMGLGIFLITIYVNVAEQTLLSLTFTKDQFMLQGNIWDLVAVCWASLPLVFTIANIMLANNLCDLAEDIGNHRYTLPYYIGKDTGIKLFNVLMYGSYVTILVGLVFRIYPWTILLVFLTLPLIYRNTQAFNAKQVKAETFSVSLKNLVLFNSAQILGLALSLIFN